MKYKFFFFLCCAFLLISCSSTGDAAQTDLVNSALELGAIYLERSEAGMALEVYERALAEVPNHERLLYNQTIALALMGRYEEAAEKSAQAFLAHPHLLRFLSAQAGYLQLAEKPDEAAEVLIHLLTLNPHDHETRLRLMDILIANESFAEAKEQGLVLYQQQYYSKSLYESMIIITEALGEDSSFWVLLSR